MSYSFENKNYSIVETKILQYIKYFQYYACTFDITFTTTMVSTSTCSDYIIVKDLLS